MKALSVIGIIISSLGVIFGLMAATDHQQSGVPLAGIIMLVGSIYFLAFSIVSIVSMSKKKVG